VNRAGGARPSVSLSIDGYMFDVGKLCLRVEAGYRLHLVGREPAQWRGSVAHSAPPAGSSSDESGGDLSGALM